MANKMLIDASHPEETRVVVVRGSRVEDFDFESASRRPLRGNIYLAKVTRVEPSLQAAFIEYGGNRHGFLAFSEIHPDYYQIPVADRQALIEAEEREAAEAEESERRAEKSRRRRGGAKAAEAKDDAVSGDASGAEGDGDPAAEAGAEGETAAEGETDGAAEAGETAGDEESGSDGTETNDGEANGETVTATAEDEAPARPNPPRRRRSDDDGEGGGVEEVNEAAEEVVESVGAEDALEELPERRRPRARQYKIQEVIKRRQILLVQVVKEERGNKGAALTTYLSLAGRYSVLMPNTARGGGISRKITNAVDRKRLKEVAAELEVPEGMGVILRTAGASRTKAEVKRDFEYLLRLWENVRELTLKSTAPTLVYEEGSLVKRSIRDLYNKDIEEILVAGEDGYREAKDFMRMLMPSHAKNVQPYRDSQPLFARFGVESQLDAMFSPQVTLKSGGYIVINPTEALVSIDVNSGRSTREHNIEDTALATNLEAADEVARQLRLRDLAGLIVIDFIDMEEKRNNRSVENRLKTALKNDRARIQVGRISHFGLMEMSRQRIRTGVVESSMEVCPHCQGTGHVRTPASVALHVLRSIEDQLMKGATHNLAIRTRTNVALYILNQKRSHLLELEERFGISIAVLADETVTAAAHYVLERGEPVVPRALPPPSVRVDTIEPVDEPAEPVEAVEPEVAEEVEEDEEKDDRSAAPEGGERGENGRRRRRRRRRRRGNGDALAAGSGSEAGEAGDEADDEEDGEEAGSESAEARVEAAGAPEAAATESEAGDAAAGDAPVAEPVAAVTEAGPAEAEAGSADDVDGDEDAEDRRRRRRGRRGGRRGRRGEGETEAVVAAPMSEEEAAADAPPAAVSTVVDEEAGDEIPLGVDLPVADVAEAAPPLVDAVPEDRPLDMPQDDDLADGEASAEVEPDAGSNGAAEAVDAAADVAPDTTRTVVVPAEEPEDPDRPKRSGWWQRRTFF
ncbi:ribonuclease E/G [Prosthecomicrobium pneumaticum]|uniref:Ribonuclease E n=1 Tax=Prosthecomicrobium pneumaticum TaxID=81895 RepID=A0A7W9L342_9HYPH|nr:ribonuclease E/G [Prosthecomicrobium pneumaticum]MBB5754160.1 ribonuclease E [Prosthecomicrobium pneumaticum]